LPVNQKSVIMRHVSRQIGRRSLTVAGSALPNRAATASTPAQPTTNRTRHAKYAATTHRPEPAGSRRSANQLVIEIDTASATMPDRDIVRTSDSAMTAAAAAISRTRLASGDD